MLICDDRAPLHPTSPLWGVTTSCPSPTTSRPHHHEFTWCVLSHPHSVHVKDRLQASSHMLENVLPDLSVLEEWCLKVNPFLIPYSLYSDEPINDASLTSPLRSRVVLAAGIWFFGQLPKTHDWRSGLGQRPETCPPHAPLPPHHL